MANAITITGLDDCLRCLDKAPDNLLKVTRTAMREAAKQTASEIRKDTPKEWRRLVRFKLIKMRSGNTNALVGLFNGHQQQGHQNKNAAIDDWFKAYWANYGTLKHRDPGHIFDNPIKKATTHLNAKGQTVSNRRNNEGQMARKFFDAENGGYDEKFVEVFEKRISEQEDKLYDR